MYTFPTFPIQRLLTGASKCANFFSAAELILRSCSVNATNFFTVLQHVSFVVSMIKWIRLKSPPRSSTETFRAFHLELFRPTSPHRSCQCRWWCRPDQTWSRCLPLNNNNNDDDDRANNKEVSIWSGQSDSMHSSYSFVTRRLKTFLFMKSYPDVIYSEIKHCRLLAFHSFH